MTTPATITRKEIADMLGVSVRTIRRRELAWGLKSSLSNASSIPRLYFRKRVIKILLDRNLIAE